MGPLRKAERLAWSPGFFPRYHAGRASSPLAKFEGPHPACWEKRIAQVEKIGIPAYVVASWTNPVHTKGTFDGYKRLASRKWLRVHNTHEWPDYYAPENVEDLHRFIDRYLRGVENGWEMTRPPGFAFPSSIRAERTWSIARRMNSHWKGRSTGNSISMQGEAY